MNDIPIPVAICLGGELEPMDGSRSILPRPEPRDISYAMLEQLAATSYSERWYFPWEWVFANVLMSEGVVVGDALVPAHDTDDSSSAPIQVADFDELAGDHGWVYTTPVVLLRVPVIAGVGVLQSLNLAEVFEFTGDEPDDAERAARWLLADMLAER